MILPKGWIVEKLGELGDWRGGGTPSKSNSNYWANGDIPWVSPKDMKRDFISNAEDHITLEAIAGSATQLIPEGSVLIVTRSGILRHSLPIGVSTRKVAINQDLKAITPHPGINPIFLGQQLRSISQPILSECAKSGTTVDSIDTERLKAIPIAVPPLPEQQRIVTKIDSLSSKSKRARDQLDHIPRLVEKYKQAILDQTYSALPVRDPLQDQVVPERGIPYGIVQTGEPFPGGIPTVRCGDIKGFGVTRDGLKLVNPQIEANFGRTRLKGGEVLIAIRGSVGETCVVQEELVGCNISREVAMIPVRKDVVPQFVMFFLASSEAKKFIMGNVKGVAQQGINLRDLKELPTPVCKLETQREVVERLEKAFRWIDRLASEANSARRLIDHLEQAVLAKAFRGELVPQNPADEPASALLERIRAMQGHASKAKGKGRQSVA